MFKKALKIAIAFVVLLGAHLGYVRLFAIVAQRAAMGRQSVVQLQPTDSRTKKEAIALAARGFGETHWSADRELPGRYYNKDRGYWMYYKEYERRNEGKQYLFKPFALIWQSDDKKELKTVIADEAVMDLDQALGLAPNKPGAPPLRIVHAQITGHVQIRDDKGTADPSDDMRIGPMYYIEYDEPTLQLKSESEVVIQDRDMRVTGYDLLIQLRPKEEVDPAAKGGGFEGAKTLFLKNNPHVVLADSGGSGLLSGKAQAGQKTAGAEPTPIDLRAAGQMQVDLPKPRLPVRVGPPAPPDPTIATFTRNVVVHQTKPNQVPDQLNCDHLKLTMMPGKKPPGPAAAKAAAANTPAAPSATAEATSSQAAAPDQDGASGGALGGLTLRRADATGHAVWLQSVSQGIKTLSNELIYKKNAPEKPDETYLRGDTPKGIFVEKLDIEKDGPNKGKSGEITTVRAIDATIFDDGQSHDPETIIARGRGILEVRPARDKPVARRAVWRDQLVVQKEIAADKQLRKRITLTGDPKFYDLAQATTLDAKSEIIVWLKPKPEPATPAVAATVPATGSPSSQTPAQPGTGKFDIEVLRALGDVHLIAPGRLLIARDVLVAVFETLAPTAPAASTAPAPTGTTTGISTVANASPTSGLAVAAEAQPSASQATAKLETKPAEPDVNVRAHHVWARIGLRPKADQSAAGKTESEIREARLRGSVFFHQDPDPGKQRGTNVTGEAIDVTNQGENKMYFKVFHVDPRKVLPLDQTVKILERELVARIQSYGKLLPLARVETDEFTVEGPIIGLNQLTDEFWVEGRGVLTQLAPRGLLSDKGLDTAADPAKPAQRQAQTNMTPMRIWWARSMTFKGQSTNLKGLPVARAQFFADVRAEMDDSLLKCQEMITYMDRTVKLIRPQKAKAAGPVNGNGNEATEPEPKPQIALIDCLYKVLVDNRKLEPETRTLVQRQVIFGKHVIYDKLTGNYFAQPEPGQIGRVYLYSRDGQDPIGNPSPLAAPAPGPSTTADRRAIRPAANPTSRPAPTRRATEVVGRNANSPASSGVDAGTASAKDKVQAKDIQSTKPALPPLKVTQVVYTDEMHGRFGTGKDRDTTETRWADFFGDVEVLNALVPNENWIWDFDDPPKDATILTAQTIQVVSEPPLAGSNGPARNYLRAWENAEAATIDTTIQSDKITYDSTKELFYAYGELDQAYLVQQKFNGQPALFASGDAIWYNRKTGESQVVDPKSFQFVDHKFGARPTRNAVKEELKKGKKQLAPLRGPGRAHFERKGFNGH